MSKAYSKTWSYREDALLAVYKQMQELSSSSNKEDAKTMMRAAIFLVKKGVDDNVYAVSIYCKFCFCVCVCGVGRGGIYSHPIFVLYRYFGVFFLGDMGPFTLKKRCVFFFSAMSPGL